MKAKAEKRVSRVVQARELTALNLRLAEAEETLRAIRSGEADAVVTSGKQGTQVFTLEGAEHAYRVLIESMNEGAVTLTATKTILYANECFARMVKCPLDQVIGGSLRRFLSVTDRGTLRLELKRASRTGSKIQLSLNAGDGSQMPVQISIRPLAKNGFSGPTFALVVTDLTEARRTEGLLRALTQRVVQVQEDERGRLALELHDNITQLLCAVLFRSQALANELSGSDGPAKGEAEKLREILGQTAEEVERISRDLRPSVLEHLGLVAVLRDTGTKFAVRTGVAVKLTSVELTARVPADTELALYRIFQEALQNIEKHARAHHVTVSLTKLKEMIQLTIKDDGAGFDVAGRRAGRKGQIDLGLLGMHERATYVGGVLTVKSRRSTGTEIDVRVPLPAVATDTLPHRFSRKRGVQ